MMGDGPLSAERVNGSAFVIRMTSPQSLGSVWCGVIPSVPAEAPRSLTIASVDSCRLPGLRTFDWLSLNEIFRPVRSEID